MRAGLAAALVIVSSTAVGASGGQTQAPANPSPVPSGFGQGAYRLEAGVVAPVLVKEWVPEYPADALRAGFEGTVTVEAVVRADGTVGDTRVIQPLQPRFAVDTAAVAAARRHEFEPGKVNGRAVAVIVTLEFTFKLPPRASATAAQAADRTSAVEEFGRGAHMPNTPGLTLPVVLRTVDPRYTSDAMRSKIQGDVHVEVVVRPDGTVGDARVVQSLDTHYGLDANALAAARQWLFAPGRLRGEAVPVRAIFILTFRLH